MATTGGRESKISGSEEDGRIPSLDEVLEHIQTIVNARNENPPISQLDFHNSLSIWWCRNYSRPFKDPLLKEYTTEELYYEFCEVNYVKPEGRSIKATQEDFDWAEEMERELEKELNIDDTESETDDIHATFD